MNNQPPRREALDAVQGCQQAAARTRTQDELRQEAGAVVNGLDDGGVFLGIAGVGEVNGGDPRSEPRLLNREVRDVFI